MKNSGIPIPTLRRLPLYYRRLRSAVDAGETYVSSAELGHATGATPEQVRKDLSYLDSQGRSRMGYSAEALAAQIEDTLGLVKDKEAVLVGAGRLGQALALYPGFSEFGLKIIVLFDNDPDKIGSPVGTLEVLPVEKLTNLVERMKIRIGILTTPREAAQAVAQQMVAGGIKAIWNFTATRLDVPPDVMVRNVDLSPEVAVLSHYIKSLSVSAHTGNPPTVLLEDNSLESE
ncbi:MAG: redox-sensing transcriptional repressor Rex [Anaerolineaceae bacterium]